MFSKRVKKAKNSKQICIALEFNMQIYENILHISTRSRKNNACIEDK